MARARRSSPAKGRRPATDAEVRALASTVRLRILRVCLYEPRTNKEIAQALGRDAATTLHHVRRLVATGFLAAQPARRGTRGAREIPYLATGKSWQVESPAGDRLMLDTFLEEVALVPAADLRMARLGLRLTGEQLTEFETRMIALLEEFRQRTDQQADGRYWSAFFAVHPDPNQPG